MDATSETKFTYDVFLSFRGEDTRHTFTGHLYDALCRKGIETFMDDEELRVGEEIAPALLKAIKESRISVIVFSENYAASSWCLDELIKILECQKEKNQIVFPIFYKVEPSDVRHQRNSYGQAMSAHEARFGKDSGKVSRWRSALVDVSKITGCHLKEGYKSEHKYITEIVSKVSTIVSPKELDINEKIIGPEHRVEELKSHLEIESSNTTCFVGIHGVGGIGKTTLAKVLFNSICSQFEGACFLSNVRETSKQCEGHKLLQQTLLSEIFGEKIQLASVNEGTNTIKRRLGQKKVLIVLDDVDKIEQLNVLARGLDWFGFGSRIIITTRDKHLLDVHQVEKTYEMNVLNNHESLELFCQHAFKGNHPAPGYEHLSNCAISYANGLPLALKVIGSYLSRKNLGEWDSALEKYKKIPHKDIQSILKISYDSLDETQKDIFLDIACFFKGQKVEDVKSILDGCNFFPEDGIRALIDTSLITIEQSCLTMHDLIQDMGREIVRQETPRKVGKRSRLWFHEDVLEVLTENTGSDEIEGIMLDPPERKEIKTIVTAFEKMKKLRILIIRNTSFSFGPSYLSNQLRLLDWGNYPSESFPPGFHPKKIVSLKLHGSRIVQPFQTLDLCLQTFEHLTDMDFSDCYSITEIPNVSGAKSLRELKLDRCKKLVTIDESVGFLPNLWALSVSDCYSITQIPNMSGAKSLRGLKLDGCKKLVTIDESVGFLPNLRLLSATNCTQLRSFVPRICSPSLWYLSLRGCTSLEIFPEILGEMEEALESHLSDTSIRELPHYDGDLNGLWNQEMTSMELEGRPGSLLHLSSFASLQGNTNERARLKYLDVSYCTKLKEIPELPSSVEEVDARHCNSLTAETLSMLWSQLRREEDSLQFVSMPKTKILEWFDHRNEGGFPVFTYRGKFPVVTLAFVFEGSSRFHETHVDLHLSIEGESVCRRYPIAFSVAENHVLLCDLRGWFSKEEWEGLDARIGHEHDNYWKTVRLECEADSDLTLSSWGVYVNKHETNMEDIQFTSSDPSSSTVFDGRFNGSRFHVEDEEEEGAEEDIQSSSSDPSSSTVFDGRFNGSWFHVEDEVEEGAEEEVVPSYRREYDEEITDEASASCSAGRCGESLQDVVNIAHDFDNDTAEPTCLEILSIIKKKLLSFCFCSSFSF